MRQAGNQAGVEAVATQIGWDPSALTKAVDDAVAEGRPGEGVMRAVSTITTSLATAQLERDGRRAITDLARDPDVGEAFRRHGPAFKRWVTENRIPYTAFAEEDRAIETFKYYLTNRTSWFADQRKADEDRIRTEERTKVERELQVRRPAPPGAALPTGAHPEGGALRRLVEGPGAPVEFTPDQLEIFGQLGLDEAGVKRAAESQAKKTSFGTPMDFIPTRNEGAV